MKQLTHEEAVEFYDSGAWTTLSVQERAAFQLQQDRLCMPFSEFHRAVVETLGRPVFTHEFGLNRDGLIAELNGKAEAPSFEQIVSMLPAHKTAIVAHKGKD